MDQHLYKFLVLHGHLAIPQVGSFLVKQQPATYDAASGQLTAPMPFIAFSQEPVPVSEKLFYDFLAEEAGVEETSAIQQFHAYAHSFRHLLEENKAVELAGVGKLEKGADDILHFSAAKDLSYLMPPIYVESIGLKEGAEETDQKDLWWFYAIILAILGLGALAYYYI